MKLIEFPFHYHIKTRWKDMDSFQHVNNAVYLSYIEDARINFFKRWNIKDNNKSIIVASIKLDYFQQIVHPCHLVIGQRIVRIGKKSFDIKSAIFINDSEDIAASSTIICVCYNYNTDKSVAVYSEIIADYSLQPK